MQNLQLEPSLIPSLISPVNQLTNVIKERSSLTRERVLASVETFMVRGSNRHEKRRGLIVVGDQGVAGGVGWVGRRRERCVAMVVGVDAAAFGLCCPNKSSKNLVGVS